MAHVVTRDVTLVTALRRQAGLRALKRPDLARLVAPQDQGVVRQVDVEAHHVR
jgi:hypothetical protein